MADSEIETKNEGMAKRPSRFARVRGWYERFERPISSISLIGGFVFDALTLKRVDMFWENAWMVGHLAIVGACIILINLQENEGLKKYNPAKLHFWLINILQFFFGGILSTILVYYFRSGSLAVSWPFFVILVAAFVANESFKKHYARLTFQLSLFFLSLFSFAIFIIPVLLHAMGAGIFLLSGAASVVLIGIFILILWSSARERFRQAKWPLLLSIGGIFLAINILYFFKLIPPIPLSLKDGDVYHSLIANGPGNYTVTYEDQGPFGFLQFYENVHLAAGDPLYVYSAVFSPASFTGNVVHEWQWYDTKSGSWVTRGRINLSVIGGGDGGYRTYSMEPGITAGKWRVNVETPRGEVIGRLQFNVTLVPAEPPLVTTTID